MPAGRKARIGVSFDRYLFDALGYHAEKLKELGVTRSEIVNAILSEFFESSNYAEAVWGAVTNKRARLRE